MGDVLVENPANHVPPHERSAPAASNIENFEGLQIDGADDYATLKKLQRQLE
jgi:26S proteasome regulatory subunit T3